MELGSSMPVGNIFLAVSRRIEGKNDDYSILARKIRDLQL